MPSLQYEKCKPYILKYQEKNKEKLNQYKKELRNNNIEKVREYERNYKKDNYDDLAKMKKRMYYLEKINNPYYEINCEFKRLAKICV